MDSLEIESVINKLKSVFDEKKIKKSSIDDLELIKSEFNDFVDKLISLKQEVLAYRHEEHSAVLNEVSRIDILIPSYSYEELKVKSVNQSNTKEYQHHRLMVNYLRHNCTPYDGELLFTSFTKEMRQLFYSYLKKKILGIISDKYPFLSNECNRQLKKPNKP